MTADFFFNLDKLLSQVIFYFPNISPVIWLKCVIYPEMFFGYIQVIIMNLIQILMDHINKSDFF